MIVTAGVWTYFVGVASAWKSVTPCEMHLPDGRSLPLLAWRSSNSAFAAGVHGTTTPSASMFTSHLPLVVIQMPDRSGCPSGAFGAGALRFGWPFGRRGMP